MALELDEMRMSSSSAITVQWPGSDCGGGPEAFREHFMDPILVDGDKWERMKVRFYVTPLVLNTGGDKSKRARSKVVLAKADVVLA